MSILLKYPLLVSLFLILLLPCRGQENNLRAHVTFLSDTIGNRYPGSDGDLAVRDYISRHFAKYGMKHMTHNFDIVEYVWGSGALRLHKDRTVTDFRFGTDFSVDGRGSADTLQAEYVVIGSCLPDSLRLHLKDKAVVQLFQRNKKNATEGLMTIFDIKQAGARALIYCMPPEVEISIRRQKGTRNPQPHQIPILHISHNQLTEFLPKEVIDSIAGKIYIAPSSNQIMIATQHHEQRLKAANLIGIKKGTGNKHIIIGAHYDTCAPDPKTGESRRGANDNASGVAMLLNLAECLHDISTQHNIIFVAFGGEEKGLLGSMAFVNDIPLNRTVITEMINLDMVGKMKDEKLFFRQFHQTTVRPDKIRVPGLILTEGTDGGSDHADFVDAGIAASYFHTGNDPTIHTSDDTSDRLNYEGMVQILKFLVDYILEIDRGLGLGVEF